MTTVPSNYIEQCKAKHVTIGGPRLGDFVRVNDQLERISVINSSVSAIQVTLPDSGAWFLDKDGYQDFAGTALNLKHSKEFDVIPLQQLQEIGTQLGDFWTFKDGIVSAGRREDFQAVCRVFALTGKNV